MVVQHNLRAMNSNRMLGLTANVQAKSTEKLSSGYKINRAADDAAGLSISEKMRKQIRGLSQASLNAQDGISAVQTAEGALNEVQDMLQRMNELAVKAANGTMSESDRSYIQNEIDQLTTEIDRVAETTKFNETYLLKGVEGTETVETEASIEVTYDKDITGEKQLTFAPNATGLANPLHATKEGKSVAVTEQNYKDFFEVAKETTVDKVTIDKESKLYDKNGEILSADEAKTLLNNGEKLYNNQGTVATHTNHYENKQDKAVNGVDYNYTAATKGTTVIDLTGWQTGNTIDVDGDTYDFATYGTINGALNAIKTAVETDGHTATIDGNKITIEAKLAGDGTGSTALEVENATVGTAAYTAEKQENGADAIFSLKNTVKYYAANETDSNNALTTEADIQDVLDQGGELFTSAVYQDAKNGYTLYDAEGNVLDAKAITEAHKLNTNTLPGGGLDTSDDVKMYVEAPKAAVEGTDYTVETVTNDIVSVKDGYEIYKTADNETVNYGNQTSANKQTNFDNYFKLESDLLMDADKNYVSADKLGTYFDEAGKYKGGLHKYDGATFKEVGAEQIDNYVDWNKTEASTEEVAVNNALTLSLQVGADTTDNNKISVDIESMGAKNLGVAGLKVDGKDSTNADAAVETIAAAIEKVSAQRSALGAVQNRLEHTIANLDNVVENTTAAESQIRDTDMATEMVKFSNNNILAQAGQAMLAQANQANQGVLSLLG